MDSCRLRIRGIHSTLVARLSLLVVNGEAVDNDVGGEEPFYTSQADACANVVLQLGCQHDRNPLLHSR